MTLIDIGANLAHDSFNNDLEEVLAQAKNQHIGHIVITGSDFESSKYALSLAQNHPDFLSATAGLHPHHANLWDANMHRLMQQHASVQGNVALGEMGLDYFRNFSTPKDQHHAFAEQLAIACEQQKPVFLHQRDAHDDFLSILKDHLKDLPAAVIHCFTGSQQELEDYLALDLYIGITGWVCDERRGKHLLEYVDLIPNDRLMIETDSPYLMPRTIRPKPKTRRNTPANLPWVLETLAQARHQDKARLAALTTENAQRFFGLS